MTFGREPPTKPHDMNRSDAKLHPVYFIHRRSLAVGMGYKTTTDPFELRATATVDITGSSDSTTVEIDTSLDTLNREVLLVWEADFQFRDLPEGAIASLAQMATGEKLIIQSDLNTQAGFFDLNDQEYIAGHQIQMISSGGGAANPVFNFYESGNPDSRSMISRDKIPLAIVTAQSIHFRTAFSSTQAIATSEPFVANTRVMCQRAKADADTYAALVTGLL